MMEFSYNSEILPKVVCQEKGYERVKTVVPLGGGDVAIAFVSSQGEYELVDIVQDHEITIETDAQT